MISPLRISAGPLRLCGKQVSAHINRRGAEDPQRFAEKKYSVLRDVVIIARSFSSSKPGLQFSSS